MRALANDREITATLGVPVRRVEAAAWFGSGLACGAARAASSPTCSRRSTTRRLTFLVISSLAAALIGRLQSLWATMFGGPRGRVSRSRCSARTPRCPRTAPRAPFVLAIVALSVSLAAPRRHDLARATTLDGGCSDTGTRRRRTAPPLEWRTIARGAQSRSVLLVVARRRPAGRSCGSDWITTFTSVAIYSVAALGFGILYGRVGMISLGQIALLTIGCWVGTRLAYATSLPFPLLLLAAGAITCAIGTLVGLPRVAALRACTSR